MFSDKFASNNIYSISIYNYKNTKNNYTNIPS